MKWGVSVRTPRQSRLYKFVGDTPKESGAVAFAKKMKKKYAKVPGLIVELISVTKAYPPPKRVLHELTQDTLWCPYCVRVRLFYWDRMFEVLRCPACTITTAEFNVRIHNPQAHLWSSERVGRVSRKKVVRRKRS